jgi:hypothetical protein
MSERCDSGAANPGQGLSGNAGGDGLHDEALPQASVPRVCAIEVRQLEHARDRRNARYFALMLFTSSSHRQRLSRYSFD